MTYTTSYTYNLAGEVVNMTYPSGRVVKHNYDVIGRLASVERGSSGTYYASSIAYNVASQVTGFTYGNGATASFGYSADRHQLTSLSYVKSGNTLLSLSYSYSQSGANNGQIAGITDNVASGRTVSYTYDHLHRLKTALTNGGGGYNQWGLSWTYDRYGNRTAQTATHGSPPANTPSVSTSTNQITGLGGYTFYYDENGNLTQDDLYKYKYDAENRLVELRNLSDTLLATYAYDGHSLRIAKVVSGWRTWYIYAGTQLISEYEDSASASYSSPTSPGGVSQYTTELYQHADHLTTRFTTDNSGQKGNDQGHYPFGEVWYTSGQADPSVRRKFTAYMQDDEAATGKINYAYYRQHSARLSRFLRPDPIQSGGGRGPQGLNRYAYVANDPSNRIDPRGLTGMIAGWEDWGNDEIEQCVDPENPLCGNHEFWSSISPMEGESRYSQPGLPPIVNALLTFFHGLIPDSFPLGRFFPQDAGPCKITVTRDPDISIPCPTPFRGTTRSTRVAFSGFGVSSGRIRNIRLRAESQGLVRVDRPTDQPNDLQPNTWNVRFTFFGKAYPDSGFIRWTWSYTCDGMPFTYTTTDDESTWVRCASPGR